MDYGVKVDIKWVIGLILGVFVEIGDLKRGRDVVDNFREWE